MAKSLPTLSSYLTNNRHSALFSNSDDTVLDQVSTMVNHDGVISVSSKHKKGKGFFTAIEDAQESGMCFNLKRVKIVLVLILLSRNIISLQTQ